MKISITLCTYNGEKFLPAQLESFLTQSRLPDELIVCDDCSTDKTAEILNNFKKAAPFFVNIHINEKLLGSTKNFEKAISLCTGDIIFLSDQDDVWLPEKIRCITDEFEKTDALGFVFTNAELVGENLQPLNLFLTETVFDKKTFKNLNTGKSSGIFFRCNIVTGATLAFRADFRNRITPFPTHISEMFHDAWIGLALSLVSEYKFIDKPLIKYRLHSLQQTGIKGFLPDKTSKTERFRDYFYRRETAIIRTRKIIKWIENENKLFPPAAKIKRLTGSAENNWAEADLHSEFRSTLSSSFSARTVPIFKELISGRYHNFSDGFFSVARDILKGGFTEHK